MVKNSNGYRVLRNFFQREKTVLVFVIWLLFLETGKIEVVIEIVLMIILLCWWYEGGTGGYKYGWCSLRGQDLQGYSMCWVREEKGNESREPRNVNTLLWSMDGTLETEGRPWRLREGWRFDLNWVFKSSSTEPSSTAMLNADTRWKQEQGP